MFRGADGVWKLRIGSDQDFLNLGPDSFNLLVYLATAYAFQAQHDYGYNPGASEYNEFLKIYKTEREQYQRQFPSEVRKPENFYYRPNFPGGNQTDILRR